MAQTEGFFPRLAEKGDSIELNVKILCYKLKTKTLLGAEEVAQQ